MSGAAIEKYQKALRQYEVLKMICEGCTVRQIAGAFGLSERRIAEDIADLKFTYQAKSLAHLAYLAVSFRAVKPASPPPDFGR